MSYTQLAFLILLVYPAFKITSMPSYFCGVAKNDAWISFLVMCILDFVMLFLIMTVRKRGGVEKLLGKTACSVLMLFVGLYSVFKVALLCVGYANYVTDVLFDHDRKALIVLPFMLIAMYIGFTGSRTIGRTCEVVGYMLLASWIMNLLFNTAPPDLSNVLPFMDENVTEKLTSGMKIALFFGDFLPLLFIRIDNRKKNVWVVYAAAGVSIVSTTLIYVAFIGLYGQAGEITNNAFARILSHNILTPEVGRLDWLGVAVWLVRCVLKCGLAFYVLIKAVRRLFGKITARVAAPVFAILCWLTAIGVNSISRTYSIAISLWIPSAAVIYGIPLVLSAISLFRGKNEKILSE
ncbi:MAG: GerAB/ArcD/ProY family transporter [Christensenellales bacterium]